MWIQILAPVLVLTAIVLGLAGFVLLARSWLEPRGLVEIDVNGERRLEVNAGNQLLWALAEHAIYLPAACGGRGTCGQCRVTVRSGGGSALPTEAAHISSADAEAGMRLACMVKVREALRIEVPRETLAVRRWVCRVVSNRNVATYLKELTLRLPEPERLAFTAGDYVLLEAPPHRLRFKDFDIDEPYRENWAASGLRELESATREPAVRAYSLANPPQEDDRAVLVVRIAPPPASAPAAPPGRVSSYIFGCKPGDEVSISGPFGEFHVADGEGEIVFIAGGAGIAPIRSMILDQLVRDSARKMTFWYGCRDVQDLCYYAELGALAEKHARFEFHVALSSPRP
ncbi:MAG TPA: NADH:ubiquinone reductase (Na(+)-transporting) subunit F, partial [Gammaproteobacteria bacterium]|nr:NADH:ubiquinone reductase (Na(+)-transporting) subunit F [Gammaproteobacteria bacterium]